MTARIKTQPEHKLDYGLDRLAKRQEIGGGWYSGELSLGPGRDFYFSVRVYVEGGRFQARGLMLEPVRPVQLKPEPTVERELTQDDLRDVRLDDLLAEVAAALQVGDHDGAWRLLPVAGPGGVPLEELVPDPAAGGPS
jgi:hypothetical protein